MSKAREKRFITLEIDERYECISITAIGHEDGVTSVTTGAYDITKGNRILINEYGDIKMKRKQR